LAWSTEHSKAQAGIHYLHMYSMTVNIVMSLCNFALLGWQH